MSQQLNPAMRRSMLIGMLRDQSLWPRNFKWDFGNCRTCGMGMLIETVCPTEFHFDVREFEEKTQLLLGLDYKQNYDVFRRGGEVGLVTPEIVADRLERVHNDIGASK